MASKTRRSAADRRSPASSGNRRAQGILIRPIIAHKKGTALRTINAANILSFSKKRAAASAGRIHGLTMVNSPVNRRSTAGAKPSGHGINAPKGQW
jgi:hypothetical protein